MRVRPTEGAARPRCGEETLLPPAQSFSFLGFEKQEKLWPAACDDREGSVCLGMKPQEKWN